MCSSNNYPHKECEALITILIRNVKLYIVMAIIESKDWGRDLGLCIRSLWRFGSFVDSFSRSDDLPATQRHVA